METYVTVVGTSLHDLTEDSIGLTLDIGRLVRLELGAMLNVLALLFVQETHSVSVLESRGKGSGHTRMDAT